MCIRDRCSYMYQCAHYKPTLHFSLQIIRGVNYYRCQVSNGWGKGRKVSTWVLTCVSIVRTKGAITLITKVEFKNPQDHFLRCKIYYSMHVQGPRIMSCHRQGEKKSHFLHPTKETTRTLLERHHEWLWIDYSHSSKQTGWDRMYLILPYWTTLDWSS